MLYTLPEGLTMPHKSGVDTGKLFLYDFSHEDLWTGV